MTRYGFLSAALVLLALSGVANAQLERQHDVHVHGTATGNLSIDNNLMRLELEIPGINLVGFEHAPADEDQQAALDETVKLLRAADWLVADPQGACEIATISAHAHGFGGGDEHDHHEHHHDHHEQDGRNDHGHAEFHLVVTLDCRSPERLSWVEVELFEKFPGNQEILIDVLTPAVVTQARLDPEEIRISLE